MKVLLVGSGGVGEAIAVIARQRDPKAQWLQRVVISDLSADRAREVTARLGDEARFPADRLDASRKAEIVALARKHEVDLVLNACAPNLNMPIFDAALEAGCHYMDMAMSLSERHPEEPFAKTHVKLGDRQYAAAAEWEKRGLLALCGSGVEPGMSEVFARYAADHLFDELHELGVRDGANLSVEGLEVAFGFSIWTTIEECLNPPIVWERDRGWFTTEPFSEPETFEFPEGIGALTVVNVEHEEVIQMPRYLADRGLRRATFKYALGDEFIQVLKTLESLGLDRTEKISVGGLEVSPRDVVVAAARDPAPIGKAMKGKTAAGIWAPGRQGRPRAEPLYLPGSRQPGVRGKARLPSRGGPDRLQPRPHAGAFDGRRVAGRGGAQPGGLSGRALHAAHGGLRLCPGNGRDGGALPTQPGPPGPQDGLLSGGV